MQPGLGFLGCWLTLTSAVFHSNETGLVPESPCRLFSAVLERVAGLLHLRALPETAEHMLTA